MARHLQVPDRRARALRTGIVAVVWLAGLVAGFFSILSIAVRYGCGSSDDGLACRNEGSTVGVLLTVTVIAVVTALTVLAMTRQARAVAVLAVGAIAALALCFVAARLLLHTV